MDAPTPEFLQACEFFQATRLLQKAAPNSPRVGYANLPKDEPVRFGQIPTLACPAALIDSYETSAEGKPSRMALTHHGLLGANGPMPLNYTELVLDRLHNSRDRTMVAFLDIFHHRMISFLARAWADNNIAVDMDRPEDSRFRRYVASLIGMGQESLLDSDELPDNSRLYYSGWLSRGSRSAEGLGKILEAYFGTKAEIVSFRGRWITIPPSDRTQLGSGSMSALGKSVILGETVWDCRLSFRVRLGTMSFSRYRELQPGSSQFKQLCCWVKSYVGEEFFWDVAYLVENASIPQCRLGGDRQLGYNTWLLSRDNNEVSEVVFDAHAA
ncbi:MAG: type VI secretion system baseplate subunit TssG [Verrucomicrobia bacterium]|nr:type VI secretion system baseplate subunit TssG [Verrucomicrobiota bacterium]